MTTAVSRPRFRGPIPAIAGAVAVLLLVAASAAAIVKPLPGVLPAAAEVAPVDDAGVNLLEQAVAVQEREPGRATANVDNPERAVSEWTPTGGGSGGGGSPKN